MIPCECVVPKEGRVITDWVLEEAQLRQVKVLMRLLEQADRNLAAGSIIFKLPGKLMKGIYYAKVNGSVALRPRCCVGPGADDKVTFLERVQKIGGEETPSRRNSKALARKESIANGSLEYGPITLHKQVTK